MRFLTSGRSGPTYRATIVGLDGAGKTYSKFHDFDQTILLRTLLYNLRRESPPADYTGFNVETLQVLGTTLLCTDVTLIPCKDNPREVGGRFSECKNTFLRPLTSLELTTWYNRLNIILTATLPLEYLT